MEVGWGGWGGIDNKRLIISKAKAKRLGGDPKYRCTLQSLIAAADAVPSTYVLVPVLIVARRRRRRRAHAQAAFLFLFFACLFVFTPSPPPLPSM